jgi:hypothetical protein
VQWGFFLKKSSAVTFLRQALKIRRALHAFIERPNQIETKKSRRVWREVIAQTKFGPAT